MSPVSRLSVFIDDATHADVTDLMNQGMTATDVVRNAIALYTYVKARQEEGYTLAIVGENGGQMKVSVK